MKSEVTISKKEFISKALDAVGTTSNKGDYSDTEKHAIALFFHDFLNEFINEVFSEPEDIEVVSVNKLEDGFHIVKQFESLSGTINICVPDGIDWNSLPEELKKELTGLSKQMVKGGKRS